MKYIFQAELVTLKTGYMIDLQNRANFSSDLYINIIQK